MKTFLRIAGIVLGVVAVLYFGVVRPLTGIYNTIQEKDQAVKASWSQVINVYKRRADLIPNLVASVKGYTSHEQQTLTQVTEARAKVGNLNVNVDNPAELQSFMKGQAQLQGALSRLMVVLERYPELKANKQFEDLQVQLEGSENRITVERQRFIEAIQDYNTYIRKFPNNVVAGHFGYTEKQNFTVDNESETSNAPVVDFGLPKSSGTQ